MTSAVLMAGMVPIAIGLNETSAQRTSMGTAVIGGVISSTFLILVLLPIFVFLAKKRVIKTAEAAGRRKR